MYWEGQITKPTGMHNTTTTGMHKHNEKNRIKQYGNQVIKITSDD